MPKVTTMCFQAYTGGYGTRRLESFKLNNITAPNITNMAALFYSQTKLKYFEAQGLDTTKVITLKQAFYSCSELLSADVSG